MLSLNKTAKVSFLFVLLLTITLSYLSAIANGATTPLTPKIEVVPKRVSLHEKITLVVMIKVEEESNFSASRPIVSGVGDACLLSGPQGDSTIVQPGEVGTLEWTFNATQFGSIKFGLEISVKKLSDGTVAMSQPLNSAEIGISKGSEIFIAGLAIIAIYVFYTSRFAEEKLKVSLFRFLGGLTGILLSGISFALGWGFAQIGQYYRFDPMITLGLSGGFFILVGLSCVIRHDLFAKANLNQRIGAIPKPILTEATGLSIVLFGLSGLFVAFNASYFELSLLIVIGIMAMAKEYIEMKQD